MKTILNFITAIIRRKPDYIFKTAKVFQWELTSGMSWCGSIYVPRTATIAMLSHEHGHCVQYSSLGFWRYVVHVCVPSLIGMSAYKKAGNTIEAYLEYHKIPSEAEADKLGGLRFWDGEKLCEPLTEEDLLNIIKDKKILNVKEK